MRQEVVERGQVMYIFQCEDSLDGIFTAIYDAWDSGYGLMNVRIEVLNGRDDCYNMELFSEYIPVEPDEEKAEKVAHSIRSKISEEAYEMVGYAAVSDSPWKADRILRFLMLGFRVGASVVNRLGDDAVRDLFELRRYVGNELHLYTGFLRFSELDNGVMFAKLEPKSDLAALIMPHFANRFPDENMVIYDVKRKKAAVCREGGKWFMTEVSDEIAECVMNATDTEADYQKLWKSYFTHMAIEERINPKLQRNMLRLRFRTHMTEFL